MEIRFGQELTAQLKTQLPAPLLLLAPEPLLSLLIDRLQPEMALPLPAVNPEAAAALAEQAAKSAAALAVGNGFILTEARRLCGGVGARLILAPTLVCAEAVETGLGREPDLVIVDYSAIWAGQEEISRAAAGEILSLLTAVADWKRASAAGQAEFDQARADEILELVDRLLDRSDDIFDLTPAGITLLYDLFLERERLAAAMGSRRAVEGSEHILAARLATVAPAAARGQLLCLATVLMSELHGQGSRAVKQFLYWIRAQWKPEELGISEPNLAKAMMGLPAFAKQGGYPHTILNEVEMPPEKVKQVFLAMRASIIQSSLEKRDDDKPK